MKIVGDNVRRAKNFINRIVCKKSNSDDVINVNRSAALVSILTIFCRFLGFARDTVIAKYLGAGDLSDSFFASFKLSNFFRKIFGEGAFFSGFVPIFTKINKEDKGRAIVFSSNIFTIITITLLVVVGLSEFFMDKIILLISPGFTGAKLEHAIKISKITFPYFYFITSCSVLWGVLNSVGVFFYYGFVPAILSIVMIFFGLVFKNNFTDITVCFAYSIVCGGIFQLLISYIGCYVNGFRLKIIKPFFDLNTKQVFKKMFNTTISTSLTQINTIIDGVLASFITSAVSYLYYADRIFYFPFSIVGVTLGIVSLPALSKAVSENNFDRTKSLQNLAIKLVLLYGIPASIGMLVMSQSLTFTIFQYGDFKSSDTRSVAIITSIFACGLFFSLISRVFSVIFFANQNTKTPMKITIFGVFVNVVFSMILVKFLGVYGIAIGTCISYFLTSILLLKILQKKSLIFFEDNIKKFTLSVLFASIVVGLVCYIFNGFFVGLSVGLALRIIILSIFGLFCAIMYIVLLLFLKINILKITFAKH